MNLHEFSRANLERCESDKGFGHKLYSWTIAEWATAVTGEVGKIATGVKKILRIRDGLPGNKPGDDLPNLRVKLKEDVADAFIYLDLFATSNGFSLEEIVIEKFNRKSEEIGYPVRIVNGGPGEPSGPDDAGTRVMTVSVDGSVSFGGDA